MKAVKKFKRLAAGLMTMFLLTGEFYGTGIAAIAADDAEDENAIVAEEEVSADDEATESETSDADTSVGEGDEEVPESGSDGAPGLKPVYIPYVKVNNTDLTKNEGKYYGTNGIKYDTKDAVPNGVGYLMYQNGVLTMKDYTIKGNKPLLGDFFLSGSVPKINILTNITETFTIRVIGDCAIEPYGVSGEDCYAIQCPGDLVIENTLSSTGGIGGFGTPKGVPGTLTISSAPVSGAQWTGSISCNGNLYIQNQRAYSFSLYDYDGLTLNCDMSSSSTSSMNYRGEVYVGESVSINGAKVKVKNGNNNIINAGLCALNGNVDIWGGEYDFKSGVPGGSNALTAGIIAKGEYKHLPICKCKA